MQELPTESSPGLLDAQRALDRDLRLAVENDRASRGTDRGPADGPPQLSERQIKKVRDLAASRVDDHLKGGRSGWLDVAVQRFLRLFRRFEISESAPKPRLAPAAGQAGAGGQNPQASDDHARGVGSSEPMRGSEQSAANRPGGGTQSSQPPAPGKDESPPAPSQPAPEPRKPITDAQVESWKATLNEEENLLQHEKERLQQAIAAAYLVSGDPDLQRLYEDPRQMQDVARMVALADWVADRYDRSPRPDEQQEATHTPSASARTTPVRTYDDDHPAVSPPGTPARTSVAGQQVAERAARPERVPSGNPHLASLTSSHSPTRPAGSPPPRPATPYSPRPDRTSGQGRGRR
ncbi:hypothetical protein ACGFIK_09220 [Micromonospora sp. NPDC048871]|uniref:hypothetical protein n=1 Tax=Micromonospora sp. NPDC048871 TaxID=3364259 RepID=UPI003711393D